MPRERDHEHTEKSWRDSATETGDGSAHGVEGTAHAPRVVCALEVGETVEEEEVGTTTTKGGQHKEVLDRIRGQRLDPVGDGKARKEEMTYMNRLKVF